MRTVPSTAMPSSSEVSSRAMEPWCCGWRDTNFSIEVTKAASEPFMSAAPRPYSMPSSTVGVNGSLCHFSTGPVGTTSVCPAKHTTGLLLPRRAHRLSTSPQRINSSLKPSGCRREPISSRHPSSLGVSERREISCCASSSVGLMYCLLHLSAGYTDTHRLKGASKNPILREPLRFLPACPASLPYCVAHKKSLLTYQSYTASLFFSLALSA